MKRRSSGNPTSPKNNTSGEDLVRNKEKINKFLTQAEQ
jgi:hypothetical protein